MGLTSDSETAEHLSMDKIGERCPVCPMCKEPLVARLPDRRFMEDDSYAECPNGHLWELQSVIYAEDVDAPT